MEKLRVGVLGGTGMVGQRFIQILENHPWFEVAEIAASPRSAGHTYGEAVDGRWKLDGEVPENVKNIVIRDINDVKAVADNVDFVLSAVNMSKDEIKKIEEEYAKTETPVVSNNSAHRWTPDVPMIIPEINPEHTAVIEYQKKRLARSAVSSQSSRTAPFRAIRRHSLHGKSTSPMKWLQRPIRQFPEPERPLRTGRK